MPIVYRGPSDRLELGGKLIKRGESVGQLAKATREALEKRGHRFAELPAGEKPQAEPKDPPAPVAGEPA